MGQKVNPISFRILNGKNWDSTWFSDSKTFAGKLVGDVKIRNLVFKTYPNLGISKVLIERLVGKINITIKTSKPGILIGKRGADIDKIKKNIEKLTDSEVSVKISEVERPDADALVVAQGIAKQLENRFSFRRAMKKSMQSAMRVNGVKGVKVTCSGRLSGAEIARTEWYREGSVPLHTIKNDIDYGLAEAHTTYGVIGIKVWVYRDKGGDKNKAA